MNRNKRITIIIVLLVIISSCLILINNNKQKNESLDSDNVIETYYDVRSGISGFSLQFNDLPNEYQVSSEFSFEMMNQKLPIPSENKTVLNSIPNPNETEVFYLWEEGNVPANTVINTYRENSYDPIDFRPYITAINVPEGIEIKGAVVLLAGGAFQFRGDYTDTLMTAVQLRENGYLPFIVDYRLRPYTQEEGALDVARAVRFIRKNADIYGIDSNDIAVMGYSAGGILAGEFFISANNDVVGSYLDSDYVTDSLDEIEANASACGMIYAFYGRLSVANVDINQLKSYNLPPTFYAYGTQDPFYNQFEEQVEVMSDVGVSTHTIVLDGWPHGFGGNGGWVDDYVIWLDEVFAK